MQLVEHAIPYAPTLKGSHCTLLMKYELRSNNTQAYICHFHVVFCSKYRRKVLIPPIDKRLKTSILETIEKWGQEFVELEVMPDHVQRHGGM